MKKGFATLINLKRSSPTTIKAQEVSERLKNCFEMLEDPRVERGRLHPLPSILSIGILAIIAGGKGWEDMELYGESKQAWLSTFLSLPNGIPCADTFRRVFEALKPQQLEKCRRFKSEVHQRLVYMQRILQKVFCSQVIFGAYY